MAKQRATPAALRMKLKQRLVFFPCLVAVLWISRPLWLAKDDEQPWKVREKLVGKLIHRNSRKLFFFHNIIFL